MELNGLSGKMMGPEAVLSGASKRPQGAVPFKFPLEPISAGNFWTKITVSSWAPKGVTEGVTGQNHSLGAYHLADIWLPMPLTLGTGYNQNFSEAGDMMVNRATQSESASLLEAALGTGKATGVQATKEVVNVVENLGVSMNASAKMSHASVINQNQGLVYDGATLRSHTLSWRMTPKNVDEQTAITEIVTVLKAYASPAVAGFWGGKDTTEEAAAKAKAQAKKTSLQEASGDNKEIFRKMGRLSIPPTVAVEFWYKDDINPFLFKIKDSFILSVEVNYTPTGTWNAYEDGAPVETQLTINIKENSIVTHEEIEGGY